MANTTIERLRPEATECPECGTRMDFYTAARRWVCPKGVQDAVDAALDKREPTHAAPRAWSVEQIAERSAELAHADLAGGY